ncbi:MAG: Hsp20/alpha crystallin family protein [Bacillota bacterium]
MFNLMKSENQNEVSDRRPQDLFSSVLEDFMDMNNLVNFKTDIKETDEAYILEAELPGMDKEDINLELDNNYLTISANNQEVIEEEKEDYIRKERRTGSYQRRFKVSNVDQSNIEAEYNDGILEVNLPKLEQEERNKKTIDIN